jgi:hypothetical protein
MAIERTLSIIKPDAVAKNVIGKIYSRFETNGLRSLLPNWSGCRRRKPAPSTPFIRSALSSMIWFPS